MMRSRIDLSYWAIMMRMKKEELELVNTLAQGQSWCWKISFTFFHYLGIVAYNIVIIKLTLPYMFWQYVCCLQGWVSLAKKT
jgi:hypothetical protein